MPIRRGQTTWPGVPDHRLTALIVIALGNAAAADPTPCVCPPAPAPAPPFQPIGPPPALPPAMFKIEPQPGPPSVLPWLTIGAGVAAVGTGVVVRQTTDRNTLGTSLLIAGGVAAIGGVIWQIRDHKRHRPLPPFIQLE